MKKLNAKGFTLIELLAVVTIMGILMLVAIPAISRTIENTRRDTFLDTAKKYVSSVKTMWTSDSLQCTEKAEAINATSNPLILSSALAPNTYYVLIDTTKTPGASGSEDYPVLLESGGKSSWANKDVKGWVEVTVDANRKITYAVELTDNIHGIKGKTGFNSGTRTAYETLKRSDVSTSAATFETLPARTGARICREA